MRRERGAATKGRIVEMRRDDKKRGRNHDDRVCERLGESLTPLSACKCDARAACRARPGAADPCPTDQPASACRIAEARSPA
jgi:hypothetical protein